MRGLGLGLGLSLRRAVIAPDDYAYANSEAQALVARMSVAPTATRKQQIDACIGALKSIGVWSKLDVLYVLGAHTDQAARLDWKSLGGGVCNLQEFNSPIFYPDRGYSGGSSSYLELAPSLTTHGATVSQNSATYGVYSLLSSTSNLCDLQAASGSGTQVYCGRTAAGGKINSFALLQMAPLAADTARHITLTRNDASWEYGFENGIQTHSIAAGSVATPPNFSVARTNRVNFAAYVGPALEGPDILTIHNALEAYRAAIGA